MTAAAPKIVQIFALRDGVQGEPLIYAVWSDNVLTQLGREHSPSEPRKWNVIHATRTDKPPKGR